MGAKTKAAMDRVKVLYDERMEAIDDMIQILNDLEPFENDFKTKTEAYRRNTMDQKAWLAHNMAYSALDEKYDAVKKWVDAHKNGYNGMDAALKKLKELINKKKVLDFFKTQKSLPEAKVVYDNGVKCNKDFQQLLADSAEMYRKWKY